MKLINCDKKNVKCLDEIPLGNMFGPISDHYAKERYIRVHPSTEHLIHNDYRGRPLILDLNTQILYTSSNDSKYVDYGPACVSAEKVS